ncbi:MAG: hypothetical protein JWN80_2212 [Microbacteriaceae bacterium]|nr:hypothetical protein [Microbacteriaceae bacterium]
MADDTFSPEERAAMKEYAQEKKGRAGKGPKAGKVDGLQAVLDKIASMDHADRSIAERVHAVIMAAVPDFEPKTWYGSPAYAKNGKVICFFQESGKFKTRYCTLGFSDSAALDDGTMWPTGFAILSITAADEKRITELVTRAAAE